jgi:hypothetical protein
MVTLLREMDLEIIKEEGLSLSDVVNRIRYAADSGWRPWCDSCADSTLAVDVSEWRGVGKLVVVCRCGTHTETFGRSSVENAVSICVLSIARGRTTILLPSWNEGDDSLLRRTLGAPRLARSAVLQS